MISRVKKLAATTSKHKGRIVYAGPPGVGGTPGAPLKEVYIKVKGEYARIP